MKTSHAVTVMGRELSVRSSASPEEVRAIETFVNGRLQEIGSALKSGDAQLVLILALLNTAEELLQSRSSNAQSAVLGGRLKGVIDKLEAI